MKHLVLFFLILFGTACEPAVDTDQFGDSPMSRRTNEDKPVTNVNQLTPVAVVTPSNGWWTGSNNLGTEVGFAPQSDNRQTILRLPEIGTPEEWTVSLYLTQALADFNSFDVTARVEFGAGGSTQVLEMDWLNGAQVTVPCNALNIIAEYSNVDITTAGSGIRLGVQVARGRRGGNQPPRLTLVNDAILAPVNGTLTLPIPPFASRIIVVPRNLASVPVVYAATFLLTTFSGPGGGSFFTGAVTGDKLLSGNGLPVSGAARTINIVNAHATDAAAFTVYAELYG